jgi:hypothetical protein
MTWRFVLSLYYVISAPVAIFFVMQSKSINRAYQMTWFRRFRLGFHMFLNKTRIKTGTSYKSHLAMALKILETPPDVAGDVVECGTWKGGAAANLSLVCKITGRKLRIFDSFEGLPEGHLGDREAKYYKKGDYCGHLEEVRDNLGRFGAVECCEFHKGWFEETLPKLKSPVLLAFVDVDLESSLDTCVQYLWPNLIEKGYMFIDEVVGLNYCALFYSEKWWREHFDRSPPGLIGAGSGLALGEYYIGPHSERREHPLQHANSGAWTRKDFSGVWTYYPNEIRKAHPSGSVA